jgi:hypothetical protein
MIHPHINKMMAVAAYYKIQIKLRRKMVDKNDRFYVPSSQWLIGTRGISFL